MNEPIHVTEKDLYAMLGEQTLLIRVQEQTIARLQAELERVKATNGKPAPVAARDAP